MKHSLEVSADGRTVVLRLCDDYGRTVGLDRATPGKVWQRNNSVEQPADTTVVHDVRRALQSYRGDRSLCVALYMDPRSAINLFAMRFMDLQRLEAIAETASCIIIPGLRADGLSFDILVVATPCTLIQVRKD